MCRWDVINWDREYKGVSMFGGGKVEFSFEYDELGVFVGYLGRDFFILLVV